MKAAVIVTPGEIAIESVPDPTPGPREVVVRVAGCGICGTDLHIMDGEFAPGYPIVPGHEFAGEVVEVGSAVTEVRAGDQVAVDPSLHCGECYYCKRGRGNLCENWAAIGVSTAGGAAEYALAPVRNCYVLPEGIDPADAALIEPLSCAVRGFDVLQLPEGDRVLVYGAGTMGLLNVALAVRAGAATVDVVDRNPDRLAAALAVGARAAVASADEVDEPHGWDAVIDCTGVVAAIEDGLARVATGGTFLQFGVAAADAVARWSPHRIYREEIRIVGSMAVLNSFDRAAELFADGIVDPALIITDRVPLTNYPDAIARFRAGHGLKVQVRPGSR